jgi:NAD(P)-dependent dehydrogenase (short-subunit alcohol dehydrogenase family)
MNAAAELFDLSGKVVVVTGGSRGLGREMAAAFAGQGADVVIASRKADVCESVAADLAGSTGRRVLGTGFHAGRWDDAEKLVEFVYGQFGRCDVLVNNAGVAPLYDSLSSITEELFDKVLAVNYKGPFRLSALLGERMAAVDGGAIINVSSIAAVQPRPHELVYAGAKAALINLTVGLARALGPAVRANAIMAGPFLTDISAAWDHEQFAQEAANEIPLRRGGEPREIVGAALYLASSASSYTTGAVLKIDGGWASSPA